jgi:hypothetical protein
MAEEDEPMSTIDMSPAAVDARLRKASQLRRLCLSLGDAGRRAGIDTVREPTVPYETTDEPTR